MPSPARTLLLALALALFFPLAASAEVPATLRGAPVREVIIEGEMRGRVSARDVGIPLGARLDRALLRRTVQRLLATGRFSDIQLDVEPAEGGVRVIARLRPRLVVLRVDVAGNEALTDEQVGRALGVSAGEDVERATLPELRHRVLEAYAQRGYHGAAIALDLLETDDPTAIVLSARIVEGEPTRIAEIRFEGDALPARDGGALRALDLDEGDVLDEASVEAGVRAAEAKLREAGYLEARLGPFAVERRGASAILRIRSRIGRHYDVVVRGHAPLPRDEVIEALELTEDPLSRAVAEGMSQRVVDLYQRNGFLDAEVRVERLATGTEGRAQLLVTIEPGAPLVVEALSFPGSAHFPERVLADQVASYVTEALGGERITEPVDPDVVSRLLDGRGPRRRVAPRPYASDVARIYYPPAYQAAVEHIQDLYRAEGFLSATVGPHRLEPSRPGRARVVVPVVEGPRTMLHSLEIEGNDHLSARAIAGAAGLERGEPFSHLALETAERRVRDLYREEGYLYAEVEGDVRFSADGTRAAVRLRIVERFQVFVGEILVEGAEATDEGMIRDLVALRPGELYRPSAARRTQERLLELGIFRGVSVGPRDPDLPARVKPIVVTVTERKPQYLDFALGASTAQGVRTAFEYGYGNLFGHAIRFTLRAQLASQFFFLDDVLKERFEELSLADRLERLISAGLQIPYLRGIPELRTSLNLVHQRENERNFGLDRNAFEVTFGYRPSRRFSTSLSSGVEYNDITLLVDDESYDQVLAGTTDPRVRQLLLVPEGRSALVAVESTTTVDFRDNPFDPTRGFVASVTAEWARSIATEDVQVGGEERAFFSHHIRAILNASGYVPLGSGVVFAMQGRYGRVFHLEDRSETYPNRQFFLGGVDTMRAYRQQAMIPEDLAEEVNRGTLDPDLVVQGGDTFLLLRSELRFPLVGDLAAGVFAEFGNLWVEPGRVDVLELRPTAGVGLRVATPIGPLALDYGFNLLYNRPNRRRLEESIGAFNFSIGLF